MIFAEQVKKQLLSLIGEMATVPWLFSKNTSFGNLGILFHEFNASFTLEKKIQWLSIISL